MRTKKQEATKKLKRLLLHYMLVHYLRWVANAPKDEPVLKSVIHKRHKALFTWNFLDGCALMCLGPSRLPRMEFVFFAWRRNLSCMQSWDLTCHSDCTQEPQPWLSRRRSSRLMVEAICLEWKSRIVSVDAHVDAHLTEGAEVPMKPKDLRSQLSCAELWNPRAIAATNQPDPWASFRSCATGH